MIAYVRTDGIYNDSRATKEIFSLLENGYSVLVIGWDRTNSAKEKCEQVFKGQTNIQFCFFHMEINHIGFKNIDKLLKWFKFVQTCLKKNKDKITAIHACNLDGGLPCLKFAKKHHIPLIYDIYDYYVDAHRLPGSLSPVVEKLEINIINDSAVCIICTEERRQQIEKAAPKKVLVIHNSPKVGKDVFDSTPEIEYDYFYCGVLGGGRLIKEIVDSYNGCYKMGFAGYGDFKEDIIAKGKESPAMEYLGEISYSECLRQEQKSLCLSAIYKPDIRNHKLCAPNKFYESLALGKPVIVCRGTGIDKIIETNNIGIVIDYDARQFYEAVDYFKNHPEYCKDVMYRSRKLYDELYSWDIMSNRLIDEYKRIVDPDIERILE